MEGCSSPVVVKFADTPRDKDAKKMQQFNGSLLQQFLTNTNSTVSNNNNSSSSQHQLGTKPTGVIGNIGSNFGGHLTHIGHTTHGISSSNYHQRQVSQQPFHSGHLLGQSQYTSMPPPPTSHANMSSGNGSSNSLANAQAGSISNTKNNSNINRNSNNNNSSNSVSNSIGNGPAQSANLNNLLLVQQLLNSSLPQLQNAANANPAALAAAVAAANNNNSSSNSTGSTETSGNGQNLQNLATLLQLAQKPSSLLNLPALLAVASSQQTAGSSSVSKSMGANSSGSNSTAVNSSASNSSTISSLSSTGNTTLSNPIGNINNNNNFGRQYLIF